MIDRGADIHENMNPINVVMLTLIWFTLFRYLPLSFILHVGNYSRYSGVHFVYFSKVSYEKTYILINLVGQIGF